MISTSQTALNCFGWRFEQLNKDFVGALGVVGQLLRVLGRLVKRLLFQVVNCSLT